MGKYLLLLFAIIVSAAGKSQIVCDGHISEGNWGIPLATAAGGPAGCTGIGIRLNSLYATANDTSVFIGVGGTVQNGYSIVLFIDSKTGGANSGIFNRTYAPACLQNLPPGTTFDAGFTADYALLISNNTTTTGAAMHLFPLTTGVDTALVIARFSGTGVSLAAGCRAGIAPSADDFSKGYEISLPRHLLQYDASVQPVVQFMAMIIGNDGHLTNQFLTHAGAAAQACFGKGPGGSGVQFQDDTDINPVAYNPSRSLPIDFLYTRAFQIGQAIKVYWASASEKDMQQYVIERSSDAMQFNAIGQVAAKGNSTGQSTYEFADAQPLPGKSFYRIKAADRNGRNTYSAVVKMQYGRVDNSLTIYPNPVKEVINLQMIGLKPDNYHLEIFNDLGQCLIEKNIAYTGGYGLQQITLLPNMKKGPYRLLLRNKAYFYKQTFIVQ